MLIFQIWCHNSTSLRQSPYWYYSLPWWWYSLYLHQMPLYREQIDACLDYLLLYTLILGAYFDIRRMHNFTITNWLNAWSYMYVSSTTTYHALTFYYVDLYKYIWSTHDKKRHSINSMKPSDGAAWFHGNMIIWLYVVEKCIKVIFEMVTNVGDTFTVLLYWFRLQCNNINWRSSFKEVDGFIVTATQGQTTANQYTRGLQAMQNIDKRTVLIECFRTFASETCIPIQGMDKSLHHVEYIS